MQKFSLAELKDGVVCKDFYQKVVDKIQADRPDLADRFVKTAGFGVSPPVPLCRRGIGSTEVIADWRCVMATQKMGIEFRDNAYLLSPKGTRTIKSDMIFSLTLGFNGIPDGKGSQYAVSLIDTVQVGKGGAKVLADGLKGKDDVMFYMDVSPRSH